MSGPVLTDPDLTVSTMQTLTAADPIALDLEGAPPEVRRVLADLSRLLLAEPAYRAEPVLEEGRPLAALRIEHAARNPVVISVSVP